MKRGDPIHYWCSSSEVASATFVRWEISRMHTGRQDTNKFGVAAIVRSDWRYSKAVIGRIPHGLRRGQYRVRPYHPLYRSYQSAWRRFRPIRRPTVQAVRKLQRRRKK